MRLFAIALVPLFASAAAAQQASPADPVAAAKQDLAEMKAPAAQQDAASALPSLDIKDFGPTPGAQRPDAPAALPDKDPALDPAKKKSGTGNWLVDAMDKRSDHERDSRSRDRDDASKADLDLLLGDKSGDNPDKDTLPQDEGAGDRGDDKDPDAPASRAYNPLDSFMSSWISANDRELLAPAKPDLSRTDLIPGLDGSPEAPAGDASPALGEADAASANPYVGALDGVLETQTRVPVLPEPADFESLLSPEVSKGLSAPVAEPAPAADERSFVPDFAQPSDDDKYFKQLKRF